MTPVKFIEAVDSYFVYSTEALFTKVHEFIELFRNNNTVLGCLAVDTWQPGDTVSVFFSISAADFSQVTMSSRR